MKCYLIIALLALTSVMAKAQSRFKTDESISSQIKNGTAPGLVFSKTVPAKKEFVAKPANAESFSKQIRSNTLPGMLYKTATPASKTESESNGQPVPDVPSAGNKADEVQKFDEKPAPSKGAQ